jgi:hypothetical protein
VNAQAASNRDGKLLVVQAADAFGRGADDPSVGAHRGVPGRTRRPEVRITAAG